MKKKLISLILASVKELIRPINLSAVLRDIF